MNLSFGDKVRNRLHPRDQEQVFQPCMSGQLNSFNTGELSNLRNNINSSKRTSSMHPPAFTWGVNHSTGEDVELGSLGGSPSNHQTSPPGHSTWAPPVGPYGNQSSSVLPQYLPLRCSCTPLTERLPLRLSKCGCHSGGTGKHRFPRVVLHPTVRPLVYLALSSMLLAFLPIAPSIALFPAIIRNKTAAGLFLLYAILTVVCNCGLLTLAFMRRGSLLSRWLKVMIAANGFVLVWFLVALTVLGAPMWRQPSHRSLMTHSGGYRHHHGHGPVNMHHGG